MADIPCRPLYAGHDAGYYTLPPDVVQARDTYRAVEAMPYPQPPRDVGAVMEETAEAIVTALAEGKQPPSLDAIEEARRAERIYQDALDIGGTCLEMARTRALSALRVHALDIIAEHLRPALEETWKNYRDAHTILAEHGDHEPRRLLSAPAKVRKSSDTCDAMAARYSAISEARGALWLQLGVRCPDDPSGKYTLIQNYHQLHATRWANARTPWHGLSVRQYLDYMAANGGQLWMPTPDEQAKAVEAEAGLGHPLKRAAGF